MITKCPNCDVPLRKWTMISHGKVTHLVDCPECEYQCHVHPLKHEHPLKLKIDELWAWVATSKLDGSEGIVCVTIGDQNFPAVGADQERMKIFEPTMKDIVKQHGQTIRLLKFSTREEIKTLKGNES